MSEHTTQNFVPLQNRGRQFFPRISESEIERAKAVPIAEIVGRVVVLNRHGYGCCPFHDEKTPSFHVNVKGNYYKCFGCGAYGDGIEFTKLTYRLSFPAAVKELCSEPYQKRRRVIPAVAKDRSPTELIGKFPIRVPPWFIELWENATHPDLAEVYLESRGIRLRPKPLPAVIRGHDRVWCAEARQERTCVLVAVHNLKGQLTALQRIWVASAYVMGTVPGAWRVTDLAHRKKTIGSLADGAAQLCEPGPVLGLTEGIEDALTVRDLYRVPVWATLGAHRLGKITMPDCVKEVVIFGDNGLTGRKAAAKAEAEYRRRGLRCQSVFPDPRCADFNSQLIAGLA